MLGAEAGMTAPPPIGEDELNAFVDGQLQADQRAAVEQYLSANPQAARRVSLDMASRNALRSAFAAKATEPLPPELNLNRLIEQRLRQRRVPWRVAASIVLAVGVGAAGGWVLHTRPTPTFPERAMSALNGQALASYSVYVTDRNHPTEVPASERDHLIRWLSNRLSRTVVPPDLSAYGLTLIGGRLLATEQGNPAALFVYEDSHGKRVSLLMRPMAPELRVPMVDWDHEQFNACSWIDKGMGYALLGTLPDEQIDRIARQIGGQG
jgi:anti-sigma factor RsiW